MKNKFKTSKISAAILISLSITSCARFDTRMQANGSYEYDEATLQNKYKTGDFTNDEARTTYDIPELSEPQKARGLIKKEVDIRPPTQLTAVIEGVLIDNTDKNITKLWFNAFTKNENIKDKVWNTLLSYLIKNNVEIISQDETTREITTGVLTKDITFGSYFNKNNFLRESSYYFKVESAPNGDSASLTVNALTFKEVNAGDVLPVNLVGRTKKSVEINLLNDLLEYAFKVKEKEQLETLDSQPLPIKLGFDENHQYVWVVESTFIDTWKKLPKLLKLLNFTIVESDKNLGYLLIEYNKPDDEYWAENNLEPFELEEAEYFVQLGELTGGTTSITWLDEDKKLLEDSVVTNVYLSITDQVRDVLLLKDQQTKPLQ